MAEDGHNYKITDDLQRHGVAFPVDTWILAEFLLRRDVGGLVRGGYSQAGVAVALWDIGELLSRLKGITWFLVMEENFQ